MKSKVTIPIYFFIIVLTYLVFVHSNRTRKAETFLKNFPKYEFIAKAKGNMGEWAKEQIENDFKECKKNCITQRAIVKTYEAINQNAHAHILGFVRYRIINNKLYRKYPFDQKISTREPNFEKAIKTLTQLVTLPDIDFIVSDMDGTPEFYVEKDFYLTNNDNDQVPLFSRAKIQTAPYVVLIPDYYSVSYSWKQDFDNILKASKEKHWNLKKNAAFWRGGSHDKGYSDNNFLKRPRVKLALLSQINPGIIDAGINVTDGMQLKEVLTGLKLVKNHASILEHLDYKYLPNLDGYMCTYPGFQWRLLSNSVVLKQKSDEVQWFYSGLEPYVHYIPIENDMSDVLEKISWAISSDDKCKEIAENSTEFVKNNLSTANVYAYLYKVILKYSKYQNFNKEFLINDTKNDSEWICIQQRKKANKILLNRNEK
ncbi:MAG: hypothetical protein A3F40_04535 [Chlamydiae bacterium RIFCSPHIGHO2_12_FULL_27_8]|nr:MAG: hypothetical protein A3F40_04535 [Chlamydiae bacterium RIFCSPHIGHO2_12_FULL_27_8]OGN66849.1 MAG: hypothetical protein A2888_00780 [Chlamydiae bacterium RIFCSPLOWO2_01_FULL_28_7]